MTRDKQLFLVSAYRVDEDGVIAEATKPEWVVETDENRAKTRTLSEYMDKDGDWRVSIVQNYRFQ